ncbi:hypothetical protein FPF71_09830 [Algibacter amylolyticus]|uniref:Glutaredoxin domain-containing protein n=1 Tax=Algibacter amylolyticus TaxID=1608400 RepID=A0A5M7B515_9FLAO|nr:hypothetical protein [Algibacter amylolyticus]KAA5824469.1 hypothetical protein F2B50_09830 [Algibacter amylolyticus]MBB5269471.1 glutaredoxin [Algibacter amylolyticus]TSJ75242.1 hypothetical protein FPF71_09830 [Algibacter amylolyticus]
MKLKFNRFFLVILIFLTSFLGFAQGANPENVTLVEKQNGKRLELYAKNTDTIPYVVFLRVTTNDYRRSSNRPVLKPVGANSEVHLLTLIKLASSEGNYEHQFIVNEVSTNLKFRKDNDDMQINFDAALKTANITLFESDACEICEDTKLLFNNNKVAYNVKDINNDQDLLLKALKNNGQSAENIQQDVFVLKIEDAIYRGIRTKKELLEALKNHIE